MKLQACLSKKQISENGFMLVPVKVQGTPRSEKKYLPNVPARKVGNYILVEIAGAVVRELYRFTTWKISLVLCYGTENLADESANG